MSSAKGLRQMNSELVSKQAEAPSNRCCSRVVVFIVCDSTHSAGSTSNTVLASWDRVPPPSL